MRPEKASEKLGSQMPVSDPPTGLEEDSLQFLWAVSYCDMLMVLMCFFVIFFQTADAPKSALNNILLSLRSQKLGTVESSASSNPSVTEVAVPGNAANLSEIARALSGEKLRVTLDTAGKSILIDFDSDLYKPGQYAFPSKERPHLDRILKLIQPYEKQLQITFVGHADPTPISRVDRKIIDSNLVLSDLRAARAVELALTSGFSPLRVVAQGDGEYSRKTRSLSIRLTELKP